MRTSNVALREADRRFRFFVDVVARSECARDDTIIKQRESDDRFDETMPREERQLSRNRLSVFAPGDESPAAGEGKRLPAAARYEKFEGSGAPLAQWIRADDYGSSGRGFKSLMAHQILP
jgi:hypothetical protein